MPKPRKPPWHKQRATRPTAETLRVWRIRARIAARKRGAETSCDLCKRPMGRRGEGAALGHVQLRVPSAWCVRPLRRRVCYACHTVLQELIADLEWKGASDALPAEVYQGGCELITAAEAKERGYAE